MTGIPDEFTRMETACAILRDYGSDLLGDGGREIYEADYATRIFEAIGLPALLERVEAAEGEWRHTLEYAATALEGSSDNGDQYCASQIRAALTEGTKGA